MKRIHRSLATATLFFVVGIGGAVYVYQTQVRTVDARFQEEQEAKRLFRFGLVHVQSGRLQGRNATIAFARDDTFTWRMTEPVDWPADVDAINAMINRMAGIKMEPLVTDTARSEDRARVGLDRPHTRLTVQLADGEHTLAIGTKNRLVDKYPITDAEGNRIGLSEPSFFWALDRDLFAFRSKRLFPFTPDQIHRVTIEAPDGTLRVEITRPQKDTEAFEIRGGDLEGPVTGDIGEIDRLLVTLTKRLVAERFVTDRMTPGDASEHGLAPPHLTVRVHTAEGPRGVRFGRQDELRAHVEGTASVAVVDQALLERLERPAAAYRDRSILRYNPRDVQRIRLTVGANPPMVVERSEGGSDWTIVEPITAPARVWRVDNLVLVYSKLKAHSIYRFDPNPEELAQWVLDPPSRQLELFDGEGELLGDLRLGKYATAGKVFAMRAGQKRVGVIEDSKLGIFPVKVDDLIDSDRSGLKAPP